MPRARGVGPRAERHQVPKWRLRQTTVNGDPDRNATTYAVDTAKNVVQLHWVDNSTGEIHRKKLSREKFIEFFASLLPSLVALEACGGSHHCARMLMGMGHQVDLLPAGQVRPFVHGNKDDAADAKAIWTAATHGDVRRVPRKSCEQQAVVSLHRTRAHWVGIRNATINSLRGLLHEFGVWVPAGRHQALRAISDQRAEIDAKLPALTVRLLDEQLRTLHEVDNNVEVLDAEIVGIQKSMRTAQLLSKVPGLGRMGSSVLAAILGDGKAWRKGREFAASLGLCPGHTGTGGKARIGSISKRGDPYARTLLVSGAVGGSERISSHSQCGSGMKNQST
jgi:transposase